MASVSSSGYLFLLYAPGHKNILQLLLPDVSEVITLGVTQRLNVSCNIFRPCSRNKQFKSPPDHQLS